MVLEVFLDIALWLSLLGALIALDHAMLGQFMISQPLVLGGIFGFALGDMQSGLLIGTMVQLIWIGILPVGAFIPSDHTVTGGLTICIALFLMQQCQASIQIATIVALAIAIPAGYFSGKLDILIRHLNSRWNQMALSRLDQKGEGLVSLLNNMGLVFSFLRNVCIYLIWLGPLALLLKKLFPLLPPVLTRGFEFAFWLLPTVSLAVMLEIVVKERLAGWTIATCAVLLPLIWIWPAHGTVFLLAAAAFGATVAWMRKAW